MIIYDFTVQERYAAALLNVARKQEAQQSLLDEARQILGIFEAVPKAVVLLEGPQFTDEVKYGFLDRTFKGRINGVFERLIYLLMQKRRIEYLQPILKRFIVIAEKDLGLLAGEVTTAVELDAKQKAYLQENLEKYVQARLNIKYVVDPSVLGGVRFRCGDLLLDDTISWRMETIKRTLETAARRVDAA